MTGVGCRQKQRMYPSTRKWERGKAAGTGMEGQVAEMQMARHKHRGTGSSGGSTGMKEQGGAEAVLPHPYVRSLRAKNPVTGRMGNITKTLGT